MDLGSSERHDQGKCGERLWQPKQPKQQRVISTSTCNGRECSSTNLLANRDGDIDVLTECLCIGTGPRIRVLEGHANGQFLSSISREAFADTVLPRLRNGRITTDRGLQVGGTTLAVVDWVANDMLESGVFALRLGLISACVSIAWVLSYERRWSARIHISISTKAYLGSGWCWLGHRHQHSCAEHTETRQRQR